MTRKRKGEPRRMWVLAPEIPDGRVGVPASREIAYRRGFYQGAHAAWQAISGGMTPQDFGEWMRRDLGDWRWLAADWIAPDRAVMNPPPEPGERFPFNRKRGKR